MKMGCSQQIQKQNALIYELYQFFKYWLIIWSLKKQLEPTLFLTDFPCPKQHRFVRKFPGIARLSFWQE